MQLPNIEKPVRQRPVMRALSTLAGVLVVSVLIGSAMLLFMRNTRSLTGRTGTTVLTRPTGTLNSVDVNRPRSYQGQTREQYWLEAKPSRTIFTFP